MPRPDKVEAVAEIKARFESAEAVFITEYRGISVKKMGELRRSLRAAGADYKVVKMTLAKRAVDDLGIAGVLDHLVGPTALAFAHEDPVAVAKALNDYAKDNEALVIKLGLLAENILQPEDVARLAAIEPREVLLAMIAGAVQAPLTAMAGLLSSFTRDAATMLNQLLEKKESDSGLAVGVPLPEDTPEPTAQEPDNAETDTTTDQDSGDDSSQEAPDDTEEE